jgi:hypothetical protein
MLADGKIIGIFRGREEFGPRALGNRSILADPTDPKMKARVNKEIKFREPFRPFAPAITAEAEPDYYEPVTNNPYMVVTTHLKPEWRLEQDTHDDPWNAARSVIPAVTHFDHSARVQAVFRETNPFFHQILEAFATRKDHPILLNTSFNLKGEPIVHTPEDAMRTFARSGMDALVLKNILIERKDIGQTPPPPSHQPPPSRLQAFGPSILAGVLTIWSFFKFTHGTAIALGLLTILLALLAWFRPANPVSTTMTRLQRGIFNGLAAALLYLTYFGIISWLGPLSGHRWKKGAPKWHPSDPVKQRHFEQEF